MINNLNVAIYSGIVKQGLKNDANLDHYIKEAIYYTKNNQSIYGIPRKEWPIFSHFDTSKGVWLQLQVTFTQSLQLVDVYRIFENSKKEVAQLPTFSVLSNEKMKAFNLPGSKSQDNKPKKSVRKSNSNTPKKPIKSSTSKTNSKKRIKKGKSVKKSHSAKAKK